MSGFARFYIVGCVLLAGGAAQGHSIGRVFVAVVALGLAAMVIAEELVSAIKSKGV